jgi:hypothetical protein
VPEDIEAGNVDRLALSVLYDQPLILSRAADLDTLPGENLEQ